ncbi:restriction endonuclease subunit S [Acinetobacter sp. NyZ410]|uniref:restriction endonuclease subunit S n=1 Tax=Acinetobacter sp. NyZ410 TaxID=2929509 RepID=UPI001FBBDE6E|nr:restriction endonuclease subunit S [Acinetobacter sp. NyZ410]UOH17796.1 restriction endonuclease subunit S [Acinetobacter sp. NyZ410]
MSLNNLPVEWFETTLDQIAEWGSGGTPSRKNASYYGGDVPWIKTGDLGDKYVTQATEFITEDAIKNSSAKFFKKGSVIMAMYGATIGKTSILGIDATTNQACAVGTPIATPTEYLYYFLKNEKDSFIAKGKGGAQPNISQQIIKAHTIYLPSLNEQQEIVRQLDMMLAQVEQIKARLDAIPAILKKFRQSVLADAVSGKLTEEWRDTFETNNWMHKTLNDIAVVKTGKTPSRKESKYWDNASIPWLTSSATGNTFSDKADEFISEIASKECNLIPFPKGTLLLAMYGEGKTRGQVTELLIEATCNQACAAILVNYEIAYTSFVKIRLQENYENIRKAASGGNQPNLNLNKVREIDIALPPLDEQVEISHKVAKLFTYADKIAETIQSAQKKVNLLTQSILAKAFSGELTAEWRMQHQDLITGVNSAEALLAKIQSEREASKPVKNTCKKKEV